jgi:hypothetical protein
MSRNRGNQYRPSRNDMSTRDRTPAQSNIEAHTYSPETGQLTVTYRGGRQYSYAGVPAEIADGLEKADSKGRFIHANIIDKFPATKIPLDD